MQTLKKNNTCIEIKICPWYIAKLEKKQVIKYTISFYSYLQNHVIPVCICLYL